MDRGYQVNNQKTFYQALIEDRWEKPSPILQDGNTKALLLGVSFFSVATAVIGLKFFKMDTDLAVATAATGVLLGVSALTEKDGWFLYILAPGILTATGISTAKAMKEGQVYVDLSKLLHLAKLFRLGWDIYKGV
ncbi:MAG: hypothetical protein KDK76_03895 [Chlamydiia bacterium]|nr:hypothetical protein [Chlamydiia bacterium]